MANLPDAPLNMQGTMGVPSDLKLQSLTFDWRIRNKNSRARKNIPFNWQSIIKLVEFIKKLLNILLTSFWSFPDEPDLEKKLDLFVKRITKNDLST